MNVAPKGMENDSNLQAYNNKDQSNSTIHYPNTMNLVFIFGDPPQGASCGGVELKQERNEEKEQQITNGRGGGKHNRIVRANVKQKREE